MKRILLSYLVLFPVAIFSQVDTRTIDVIDYEVFLKVSDSSNRIEVDEWIRFFWLDTSRTVVFDLTSVDESGKGMKVDHIIESGDTLTFEQRENKLFFTPMVVDANGEVNIQLHFSGIPADGLVISENKFGDRTFFGDNWPNRAHNWFACLDHPSDKATISFQIQAPEKYDVVSVGKLLLDEKRGMDHYFVLRSNVPIPTKVMVVGIADFSFYHIGSASGVQITNAVYIGENEDVHEDMEVSAPILDFFEDYIAPYEFEELENVQSTTRYGGMENAGCIFYDENAFNGRLTGEDLLAHEIAHQWFGNSATESDWPHLWLSEGFATYFTNLYIRSKYGEEAFDQQLQKDRKKVLQFAESYEHPVVDTVYSEIETLLNANAYQKGSWVLHMLHYQLGDSVFKKCIQEYYGEFRLANASTSDLQSIFEKVSGVDLDQFFRQWLYTSGHPELKVTLVGKRKVCKLRIEQVQKQAPFQFPLMIRFTLKKGEVINREFQINSRYQEFTLELDEPISDVKIDPGTDLLFRLVK